MQNPRAWQAPERNCISPSHTRVFYLDDANAGKTLNGLVPGRHLLPNRRRPNWVAPVSGNSGRTASERTSHKDEATSASALACTARYHVGPDDLRHDRIPRGS